jgi:hypothetical protein
MRRVVVAVAALSVAGVAFGSTALDFSTEADETGDVFALSVEQRYAGPISIAAAVADLRAQGMTCSEGTAPTCSKSVSANGCTYTFVATVTGTAERAVVRGVTQLAC